VEESVLIAFEDFGKESGEGCQESVDYGTWTKGILSGKLVNSDPVLAGRFRAGAGKALGYPKDDDGRRSGDPHRRDTVCSGVQLSTAW